MKALGMVDSGTRHSARSGGVLPDLLDPLKKKFHFRFVVQ